MQNNQLENMQEVEISYTRKFKQTTWKEIINMQWIFDFYYCGTRFVTLLTTTH